MSDNDIDDDSDSLFDSDEEKQILSKVTKTERKVAKKSRLDEYEDEDADDDYDVDESNYGDKAKNSTSNKASNYTSRKHSDDNDDFDNVTESANDVEGDYDDYLSLFIRRVSMEKWVKEPFFDKVVKGCFVRVTFGNIGENKRIYKLCEVVEVIPYKRKYKLTNNAFTDQALIVAVGTHQKTAKIIDCSNSRFTQEEFDDYILRARDCRGYRLLTKKAAGTRKQKQQKALQHTYTHAEIDQMIEKRSFMLKAMTSGFTAAKETIERNIRNAIKDKDTEKLESLQKELELLINNEKLDRERYEKANSALKAINSKNLLANRQLDQLAGDRKRQKAKETGGIVQPNDPFARRETAPKTIWKTGKKKDITTTTDTTTPSTTTMEVTSSTSGTTATSEAVGAVNKSSEGGGGGKNFNTVTVEEARIRVMKRLGVDPIECWIEINKKTARERYLDKVCSGLPPKDSEEREIFRKSFNEAKVLSLQEYIVIRNKNSGDE